MNRPFAPRRLISAASRAIPRLSFVAFGVVTVMAVIYTPIAAQKDWRLFYDSASLVLSGRSSELYPGITAGYPFLYPPPLVWHVAWLGLLPPGAAHVSLVLVMVAFLCASLFMMHNGLDGQGRRLDSWIFVVLSSAGWAWTLTTGHIAAWFVFLITAALRFWMGGKTFAAGLALGCVAIKPHYCIPILLCVALARAWRVLGGALAAIAILALTTLPLGHDVWARYFEQFASLGGLMPEIPPWKQITLLAFWRSVLSGYGPGTVATATILSAAPCIFLVALAWVRSRAVTGAVPRLLALTVLTLLSCNAYAFHYDALLLAVPGAVWFLRGDEYGSARSHCAIGVAILLTYAAQHASAMLFQGGVALTGPLLAAWVIIDARDFLRTPLHSQPAGAVSPPFTGNHRAIHPAA